MQTITIAVSAILIAAGLVTAPGLINNARDNNARSDLANIAFTEEAAQSDVGSYFVYDNHPASTNTTIPTDIIAFTPSADVRTLVLVEGDSFVALSKSSSGKVFFRSSLSAEVREATQADLASEGVVFNRLAGSAQEFAGVEVPDAFSYSLLVDAAQAVVDDAVFVFPGQGGNPGGGNPGGGGGEVTQVPCTPIAEPTSATSYGGKTETKTLTVCDSHGTIYSASSWSDGADSTWHSTQAWGGGSEGSDPIAMTSDAGATFVYTATATIDVPATTSLTYTGMFVPNGRDVECEITGSPAGIGETTTITCVGTAARGEPAGGLFQGSMSVWGNPGMYSSMGDLMVVVG